MRVDLVHKEKSEHYVGSRYFGYYMSRATFSIFCLFNFRNSFGCIVESNFAFNMHFSDV